VAIVAQQNTIDNHSHLDLLFGCAQQNHTGFNSMYVCLCHGVTDSAIRAAVNNGADTFMQVSFSTGCATQCGSCAKQVRSLLKQCLEARDSQDTRPVLHIISAA
jgi:bacterioferritin-associated ferredoxin